MKKFLLFILSALAFTGMSVAQNIYSSGYFTNSSGKRSAAVYRNGTKLYDSGNTTDNPNDNTAVNVYNDNVYWVINSNNPDGSFNYGDVLKNSSAYLYTPSNSGGHIFDLCRTNDIYKNLWSVGCKTVNGVKTAVRWQNNDSSPFQMGNGNYESVAFGATSYGLITLEVLYSCGYQYSNSSTYHGVIWNNNSVFHDFPDGTKMYDITYYNGYLWTVGTHLENGSVKLKVWKTSINNGSTSEVYTLASSNAYGTQRTKIFIDDAGDIYVTGQEGSFDRLWVNENVYFTTPYYYTSAWANSDGVYWAGCGANDEGTIWKDGQDLYTPSNCDMITNFFVEEPECDDPSLRALPYSESFETGETDWPCWTIIDVDNNNGTYLSSWSRCGRRLIDAAVGNYCAGHSWGPSGVPQEGWLVSPGISLQGVQGSIQLTFKTREASSGSDQYSGVWVAPVSNSGINTNDFTAVWSQSSFSNSWKTVTVDLSAYKGQNIRIAFKYSGTYAHSWCIDDVNITETAPTQYAITANANPTNGGTVTGGGTYNAGATCTLTATPASGYQFDSWKKNGSVVSTNATYSFTVTESATYTAYFTQAPPAQYTITVNANNTAWGTVTGNGVYDAGTNCTITATPNNGYEFSMWTKNGELYSYYPNESFTVTENATFTAYFTEPSVTYYTITTSANPTSAGTVEGAGSYPAGETVFLTATANQGWQFSHWNDGVTSNPRSITINGNATYTAYFEQQSYTLTVNASPAEGGTVTGGGTYHFGEMATLTATANNGFTFVSWSDGNTNATRSVTVTGNASYTALFIAAGATMYTVTVLSDNPLLGSVSGGGTYPEGSVIQISATPSIQGRFVSWNDGNTDNPRDVTVTGNLTFKAQFTALQQYTITVESANPTMGSATGGGTFLEGTTITISATAFSGYYFTGWDDGNANNPREIVVTQNASYKAQFSANAVITYTLSVICNNNEGTVIGDGTYTSGATATIAAIPKSGFVFDRWNDDNTLNPRQVTVNDNMVFVAFFKSTGISENESELLMLYPNPANDHIRIDGIEANTEVRIYNALGALVKVTHANPKEEIGISELSSGLYLIRFGNTTVRFVKEQ